MPDAYFRRVLGEEMNIKLGPQNSYGTGVIFTPKEDVAVAAVKEIFELQAAQRGLKIIGWRSIQAGAFISSTQVFSHLDVYLTFYCLR